MLEFLSDHTNDECKAGLWFNLLWHLHDPGVKPYL